MRQRQSMTRSIFKEDMEQKWNIGTRLEHFERQNQAPDSTV